MNLEDCMVDEKMIQERIKGRAEEGRIACEEALKLARELEISSQEVGRILNEMKIKVVHCQLGCFP
jgi:hypothetical protein